MSTAITRCILCDLHGFLVQRPTIHRQSVVEFGWVVGVPGKFNRDIHVHARHAAAERGVSAEAEVGEEEVSEEQTQEQTAEGARRTEVAAQMLYHRPTRSGVYALVTLFQPWRIGLNEVNYTYALDSDEERTRRYQLALTAYEWTLKRPDGAMTTTRFPHIEGIEGIVLISRLAVPVPMLSPLREDYREKLKTLAEKQGIEFKEFNDLDELVNILSELQESTPFRMPFPDTPADGETASTEKSAGRRRGRRRREATETPQESTESGEFEEASSDSPADTE
jgi:CRISPR-associated protein Cst2